MVIYVDFLCKEKVSENVYNDIKALFKEDWLIFKIQQNLRARRYAAYEAKKRN